MVGKHDLRSHFRWLRIREFTQEWQTHQWFVKFQWICTFEPQNCSTLKSLKMIGVQSLESSKNRLGPQFQVPVVWHVYDDSWVRMGIHSVLVLNGVCVCILLVFPSYKLGEATTWTFHVRFQGRITWGNSHLLEAYSYEHQQIRLKMVLVFFVIASRGAQIPISL